LLYNNGFLALTNSMVSGNSSLNRDGGGIFNDSSGTMTLTNSMVSGNSYSDYAGVDPNPSGGGGIYNRGTMTLTNSMVSGNSANSTDDSGGGIFNDNRGTLTLTNSMVSGNSTPDGGGGGIYNVGTMTLMNSTISSNTASGDGGGIINLNILKLINSTVSGNSISQKDPYSGGGGIYNGGIVTLTSSTISSNSTASHGGGIYNFGTLALANSTIVGNSASGNGGGIAQWFDGISNPSYPPIPLKILFCTIYANSSGSGKGGGLWTELSKKPAQSYPVLANSIIAANHAQQAPDISGPLITMGYNLVQNFAGASFADPQNLHFTDQQVQQLADLYIDPTLHKNGGPTLTLALSPDSPAINAIPPDACDLILVPTDQRGVKRPQGSGCDIGAYEYQLPG
jgi:hypothetical protein